MAEYKVIKNHIFMIMLMNSFIYPGQNQEIDTLNNNMKLAVINRDIQSFKMLLINNPDIQSTQSILKEEIRKSKESRDREGMEGLILLFGAAGTVYMALNLDDWFPLYKFETLEQILFDQQNISENIYPSHQLSKQQKILWIIVLVSSMAAYCGIKKCYAVQKELKLLYKMQSELNELRER